MWKVTSLMKKSSLGSMAFLTVFKDPITVVVRHKLSTLIGLFIAFDQAHEPVSYLVIHPPRMLLGFALLFKTSRTSLAVTLLFVKPLLHVRPDLTQSFYFLDMFISHSELQGVSAPFVKELPCKVMGPSQMLPAELCVAIDQTLLCFLPVHICKHKLDQ